jgi:uncharacterized protein YjbI with pentapeptide repeats
MIVIRNRWNNEPILSLDSLIDADISERNLNGACLAGMDLRGTNLQHTQLKGASLSGAVLVGANLSSSILVGADLYLANLSSAVVVATNMNFCNLNRAKFYDADLRCSSFYGASVIGASLYSSRINWQSHVLIAEILRQHAGESAPRRSLAGLIAVSTDWCHDIWADLEHSEREWAIETLKTYVQEGDRLPNWMKEK